jgi:iron complex transport system substrate-binding protein
VSASGWPQRIVCLTEETTEVLYLLGAEERIVGVSGYTVRPPQARSKPRVSAFTSARYERILALQPDLVLAFSNLQAEIARELLTRGLTVFTFNQRSIGEILDMIFCLSRIVGAEDRGTRLGARLHQHLRAIEASAIRFTRRPRVFFEEWNQPLISGIRWVDELVEIAGGTPLFPELRRCHDARDRIVDPEAVMARDPEVVIASWCGTKVNKDAIRARAGWDQVSAVRNNQIYEIKSTYILQPGPAALTEGVRQLHAILAHSVGVEVRPDLRPEEKMDPAATGGELKVLRHGGA